ncbi:hypothetical protein C8J57DRAFT_1468351 [Mycena rebaudengoi]|nr:hypothetical protein C8J57DRAFT_1468351 [Mycena rebaudengoi]
MRATSEIIEIPDSDSDNDDDQLHVAAPPPSSSQFSHVSSRSEVVDLCEDTTTDDDAPPLPGSLFALAEKYKRKRSLSPLSRSSSVGHCDVDEDEDSPSPRKVAKKTTSGASKPKAARKSRKSEAEKAATKEQKQKDAAAKKALKAAEKTAKLEQAALAKAAKAAHKSANKLVGDKKATLADMHLVIPAVFAGAPLEPALRARLEQQHHMRVSVASTRTVRGCDVFTWSRTVTKEYDAARREWVPVDEREECEGTVLVYLVAGEAMRCLEGDGGGLRDMVKRYTKADIERKLAALQMAEHTHHLCVESVADATERLYDLSADLGIKPYKCVRRNGSIDDPSQTTRLIERSHLPFCADTHQAAGTDLRDTWEKMLAQVHRLPQSGAQGIAADFPTARTLFERYRVLEGDVGRQRAVVSGCQITHNQDGTATARDVGAALANKIATVMYGTDPLELVVRGSANGRK